MAGPYETKNNGPRVLLIEDNRVFREEFKNQLVWRFSSIAVDEAENADYALKMMKGISKPPDLVITDIRMSGLNGIQFTKKVKDMYPGMKVVIVTSYDISQYREAAYDCGADGFFAKGEIDWDAIAGFLNTPCKPEP